MRCRCKLCGGDKSKLLIVLNSKPVGETKYLPSGAPYYREVRECLTCGVFFNCHEYDLFTRSFYEGQYNSAIDAAGLERRFKKIINLPIENSDNKGRVRRITKFLKKQGLGKNIRLLDVGSGTGVFPYEMAVLGFNVSAVDPDPNSIAHMRKHISLENIWEGSINDIPYDYFDIITFNKVLEHIENPFDLIEGAVERLKRKGIIYIELPFGTELLKDGLVGERAEFFIEHFTTFTYSAFQYLAKQAQLTCLKINNITDPSGKHTIYGFFTPH